MEIKDYKKRIPLMKVPSNGIIREAAKAIAEGLLGTAIVVEPDSERFISVVTDGDIRRAYA